MSSLITSARTVWEITKAQTAHVPWKHGRTHPRNLFCEAKAITERKEVSASNRKKVKFPRREACLEKFSAVSSAHRPPLALPRSTFPSLVPVYWPLLRAVCTMHRVRVLSVLRAERAGHVVVPRGPFFPSSSSFVLARDASLIDGETSSRDDPERVATRCRQVVPRNSRRSKRFNAPDERNPIPPPSQV